MSYFKDQLAKFSAPTNTRRWVFVPYDQLSQKLGALATAAPEELGLILFESSWKALRRPYHKQKLALILCNMRRFALEQAQRGCAVRYIQSRQPYSQILEELSDELGPIEMLEPAERELAVELSPLKAQGILTWQPHSAWLSTPEDFAKSQKSTPWRMDAFYRFMRKKTGILMEKGKPIGGKYSFDAHNREPWDGQPKAPKPPRFRVDKLRREVGQLIEEQFPKHPGSLDLGAIPASAKDAEKLWSWAKKQCLEHFGRYEDAMSTQSSGLFHTRLSSLLNIHRLMPKRIVDDVLQLDIPLPSKEGFIRQVLGWREFVRHVHRATDGFRKLPEQSPSPTQSIGSGGWDHWTGEAWSSPSMSFPGDDSAAPNTLAADAPLIPAYWGQKSGLNCLDEVVADVWREAWSHHIPRLMVLSNIASLLALNPRELTDWFWCAYVDAFDWVVEPNVLAMGTYAFGPVMTTKPYISGSGYIDKMSDYCQGCAFHPKKNCPLTRLYWQFLERHKELFADNFRMKPILRNLERRSEEKKKLDRFVFEAMRKQLSEGKAVTPDSLQPKANSKQSSLFPV